MIGAVVRRLGALLPVWIGISALAFGIGMLPPGDPAVIILQRRTDEPPTAEAVAALRRELQLDDPVPIQYGRWLVHAIAGDLGRSYRTSEPVLGALARRIPYTLAIAAVAIVLAVALSLPLGVVAADRHGSAVDHASRIAALVVSSLPSFWLGYLLILAFAVGAQLLPVAGTGGLRHMVLPSLTLALGAAGGLSRLTRAVVLEELERPYVRTATAKGASRGAILVRHCLRNASIALTTAVVVRFGHLLGGAVIVETVFAWPGIGSFAVDAIYDRDFPVVQGFVLFTGTVFLLLNLIADLAHGRLDPRVAREGAVPSPAR